MSNFYTILVLKKANQNSFMFGAMKILNLIKITSWSKQQQKQQIFLYYRILTCFFGFGILQIFVWSSFFNVPDAKLDFSSYNLMLSNSFRTLSAHWLVSMYLGLSRLIFTFGLHLLFRFKLVSPPELSISSVELNFCSTSLISF